MTGRELCSRLNFTGQEKALRKLALSDKLATADEIAVMTDVEVCDLIVEEYTLVYTEGEELGLVKNDQMEEYKKLVQVISR